MFQLFIREHFFGELKCLSVPQRKLQPHPHHHGGVLADAASQLIRDFYPDILLLIIIKTSGTITLEVPMPHTRKRYLESVLKSALQWSPVVGVFGLRQVGKTTLTKEITQTLQGIYETFDREIILQTAQETPLQFLNRDALLTIDEAQKAPTIFPAIKELVGTRRQPGRFLLTGSVRFTLKEDIRESLTGRIVMRELLPFSFAEAHLMKPSRFLSAAFETCALMNDAKSETFHLLFDKLIKKLRSTPPHLLARQLVCGGLPIPCFARDDTKRSLWFEAYFETLLTRDVVLVDRSLSGISLRQGLSFLKELSFVQGNEVNLSDLSAKTSMTQLMAGRLLRALEVLALIDMIPPESGAIKSIRKFQVEWKDSGLWGYLTGQTAGKSFADIKAIHLLLSQEFRFQLSELSPIFWNFYRHRDGASISWVFRKGKQAVAIKFHPSETPGSYDIRVLKKFVSENKESLAILIGPEKSNPMLLDKKIGFLPLTSLF